MRVNEVLQTSNNCGSFISNVYFLLHNYLLSSQLAAIIFRILSSLFTTLCSP
ncbi:hypothetical protein LguiB_005720 [Lonicera macranthoides]